MRVSFGYLQSQDLRQDPEIFTKGDFGVEGFVLDFEAFKAFESSKGEDRRGCFEAPSTEGSEAPLQLRR